MENAVTMQKALESLFNDRLSEDAPLAKEIEDCGESVELYFTYKNASLMLNVTDDNILLVELDTPKVVGRLLLAKLVIGSLVVAFMDTHIKDISVVVIVDALLEEACKECGFEDREDGSMGFLYPAVRDILPVN
jgi:hypothetical protein